MEIRFGWEEDTLQTLVTDGQMEHLGIMIICILAQRVTVFTIILAVMIGDALTVMKAHPAIGILTFVKYNDIFRRSTNDIRFGLRKNIIETFFTVKLD